MRISDAIVKKLEKKGVQYVFGISAGTVSSLYDSLNDTSIKAIVTKNEAGAVYSANKYAESTNKIGVCIAAGGVGINNMTNGIADAMRNKLPVLIISGYVHRWQIGKGAIQELNTQEIFKPITKYSKTILDEKEVLIELEKSIEIALTPPYGPVHISIPIDIQISEITSNSWDYIQEVYNLELKEVAVTTETKTNNSTVLVEKAVNLINNEEQGIILVGRGCRGLSQEVMKLSNHLSWPIITTPQAKGIVPSDFNNNLGNYGFSSTDSALDYVEKSHATCLLVLGSSLGESATRNYNDILVKNRKVIHIDWDESELNKVFKADIGICSDLKNVLPEIISKTLTKEKTFSRSMEINTGYTKDHSGLSIRLFLERIVDILPPETYFVSDIGEYMNFLFKYLPIKEGTDFNISLNYGAMGIGVGGAIGTHVACPEKQTVVIVGDGSFFMNGTEILTAKEYKLPIIYFIINNSMLGYVEHGHQYLYKRSVEGFIQERISIKKVSEAMGIKAIAIKELKDLDTIKDFISDLDGPCVIELITDGTEKVPTAERFKALKNE